MFQDSIPLRDRPEIRAGPALSGDHQNQTQPFGVNVVHDIRWLRAGQEFNL